MMNRYTDVLIRVFAVSAFILIVSGCVFPVRAQNVVVADPVEGIAVDGNLSDWPKESRQYAFSAKDGRYSGDKPRDDGDVGGVLRLVYSERENALYVAVEVRDESIVTDAIPGVSYFNLDGCHLTVKIDSGLKEAISVSHFIHGDQRLDTEHQQVAFAKTAKGRIYEWRTRIEGPSKGQALLRAGIPLSIAIGLDDRDLDGSYSEIRWEREVVLLGKGIGTGTILGNVKSEQESTRQWQVQIQSLMTETLRLETETDSLGVFTAELPTGRYSLTIVEPGREEEETVIVQVREGREEKVTLVAALPPYRPVSPDPVLERWRWRSFLELNGLGLQCLAEDRDKNMWFGIRDGVVRYDGRTWTTFTSKDGLLGAPVWALCATQDGSVYVGTGEGISRFRNGVWQRVIPKEGHTPWFVYDLEEMADGRVLAGTVWGALILQRDEAVLYTTSQIAAILDQFAPGVTPVVVPDDVAAILRWVEGIGVGVSRTPFAKTDRFGVITALADNGPGKSAGLCVGDRILAIDGQAGARQEDLDGPAGTHVTLTVQRVGESEPFDVKVTRAKVEGERRDFQVGHVFEAQDGELWFTLLGESAIVSWGIHGVRRYDGMVVGANTDFAQTPDGSLWVNGGGAYRFDGTNWIQSNLSNLAVRNATVSIHATQDGTVWFGGYSGTLIAYRDGGWKAYQAPDEIPAPEVRLWDMLESSEGALWIAGLNNEVARLDYGNHRWQSYEGLRLEGEGPDGALWFTTLSNSGVVKYHKGTWTHYGTEHGLMAFVARVIVARDGTVWASGRHGTKAATARLDGDRWTLETHPQYSTINRRVAYAPPDGTVWFGTREALLRFDGKTWSYFAAPNCYGIAQTPDGTIWGGSFGLQRFDGGSWHPVSEPDDLTGWIDDVHATENGDLWVGTRASGVFRFDGQVWEQFTERDGLPSNLIRSFFHTEDGHVWAATNKGIARFDGQVWTTHALPVSLSKAAVFRALGNVKDVHVPTRDGAIWLNLSTYPPLRVRTVRYEPERIPPDTEITLSVNEISQPGNTPLSWQGLDPWRNTPEGELQFSWRLDGGVWSPFSKKTSEILLALPSGDHTFEVKARDRDFNEDPTPAQIFFSVIPPVWQQFWVLALVAVFLAVVGIQARRILARDQMLQASNTALSEANRKLSEAHQQIQEKTQTLEVQNADLATARDAAESANRAKSQFLANMSHELRTPLNGILGYAQILKRNRNLDRSQHEGIEIIRRSGEYLLTLINDLLDLARIEARKTELESGVFHLPTFLKDISDMTGLRAERKGVAFVYDAQTDLPVHVAGDERHLRQVLLNLLGNAVKFTEAGQVTLQVLVQEDGRLRFEVADTGIGIPEEKRLDIFKPFEQVVEGDKRAEGTGLGLAISHQLVGLMGGTLQVESEVGKGSRFWFEVALPEVVDVETITQRDMRTPVGFEGQVKNVLVVDDKSENRLVLKDILVPLGFEVREAMDGREAVDLALSGKPDLILMDLVMPVLDGFEAIRQMRQSALLKNTAMIALSASVFEQDRQKSLDAGYDAFLPKPVRMEDLLEKIGSHLGLTWIYEEASGLYEALETEGPMVFPPKDVLMPLLDLVQKGQIVAIQEAIGRIEQSGGEYRPFAARLREMADGFQLREMREFLASHIVHAL